MSGVEFSELQAVDFALGAHIGAAYSGHNLYTGPKEWREFLNRPLNRRVFRHKAASPLDFVKDLTASKLGATTDGDGATLNYPLLPAVYYYRMPGGSALDIDKTIVRAHFTQGSGSEEQWYDGLLLNLVLDYRLCLVSWDQPTIDKLWLAWSGWVGRMEKQRFPVTFSMAGYDFSTVATIQDPRTIIFADTSVPSEQGRLFACEMPISVTVQVVFVSPVTLPDPLEVVGVLERLIP